MKILENKKTTSTQEIADFPGEGITPFLSGHPKILLNKGRLGFTGQDLKKYAPEYAEEFQVLWLAVKKDCLNEAFLSEENQFIFEDTLPKDISIPTGFRLLPVHPWQFTRYIETQYQREIAKGDILPLMEMGPRYSAQISVRTLTQASPGKPDLKLSLTILNTSAYRGISADNLTKGPALSLFMEKIINKDSFLKNSGVQVLKELYVASFLHPTFSQIKDSPYRYNELLGCVVRESTSSKLIDNEIALMTGSLFFVGEDQKTLIGEYIARSGLSSQDWIKKYFKHIILPLYHLQLTYGIGIVSHGQNIILKLNNYTPSGLIIKDFQGDLRINQDFLANFPEELQTLKALPGNYLIHDLITGHFITVLRFISPLLEKSNLLNEKEFYGILGSEVHQYLKEFHPNLPLNHEMSLLRLEFEKVILNKVRFNIGYEDSAARPLPLLGKNLMNPLAKYLGEGL